MTAAANAPPPLLSQQQQQEKRQDQLDQDFPKNNFPPAVPSSGANVVGSPTNTIESTGNGAVIVSPKNECQANKKGFQVIFLSQLELFLSHIHNGFAEHEKNAM